MLRESLNVSSALRVTSLVILALAIASPIAEAARVTLLRTPDGGIQPQAAVDSRGMVHLIYFKGEADGGNVFMFTGN